MTKPTGDNITELVRLSLTASFRTFLVIVVKNFAHELEENQATTSFRFGNGARA